MHKISTFLRYTRDFIKWREYRYIFTPIKYILLAENGLRGYAFEPIKSNCDALRINLILNGLEDKIKLFPVTPGAEQHIADFEILKVDDLNMGARKIIDKTQNHADN